MGNLRFMLHCCCYCLGAHQHTLQSFKSTILSRNLDQNMLKNAFFMEKAEKIAAALGAEPSNAPR